MPDRINPPDLSAFSQPAWNDAQSIASALQALRAANDESSSLTAYHKLLNAVGNDHAGTYYSIALAIPSLVEDILRDGNAWARDGALQVLIELCGSFTPEPGQELYSGMPLHSLITQASFALFPLIDSLANGSSLAAKSARELLEIICPPSASAHVR